MPSALKARHRPFAWIFAFLLLLGVGSVYFTVGRGSDRLVSLVLTRELGLTVQLTGVRWDSWNAVHFDRAALSGPGPEAWFESGPGALQWTLGDGGLSGAHMVLSDAVIEPALVSRFLRHDEMSESASSPKEVMAPKAVLGFRWQGSVLSAAHVMLEAPEELLKQLPSDWVRRLPANAAGQRIIKCSFRDRQWTLFGRSGPLLRASWEMAYTTSP